MCTVCKPLLFYIQHYCQRGKIHLTINKHIRQRNIKYIRCKLKIHWLVAGEECVYHLIAQSVRKSLSHLEDFFPCYLFHFWNIKKWNNWSAQLCSYTVKQVDVKHSHRPFISNYDTNILDFKVSYSKSHGP